MPSRVVCFVCGSLGGEFGQLHSRPPPPAPAQGRKGERAGLDGAGKSAYFPFLEHHDPPQGCRPPDADGMVDSCRVCHAFLTQQWANYERSNTPAVKRLYWLKRLDDGQFTGAEMKLQGEYMAQVMGLQYQPNSDMSGGLAPPQAVSPDSRDGFKNERGRHASRDLDVPAQRKTRVLQEEPGNYDGGGGGGGVLDLSVSIKTEPSLAKQPRKLSRQRSTEKHGKNVIPEGRDYREPLREGEKLSQPASVKPELDEYVFVCYTCGVESSGVAAKFVSSQVHAPGEPYFPFLARLAPYKGASPMTAQGVCRVCDLCFSSLCHQWLAYEQHGTPSSARIFRLHNLFFSNDASLSMSGSQVGGRRQREEEKPVLRNDNVKDGVSLRSSGVEGKQLVDGHRGQSRPRDDGDDGHSSSLREVCYLCSQMWSPFKMCPLYTSPAPSGAREEDQMFFPFIRELRRPQGARPLNPDGSVRVCISCSGNLQAQWQHYQADGTPNSKRRYSLLPYTTGSALPSPSPQQLQPQRSKSPDYSDPYLRHTVKPEGASKLPLSQPLHLDIVKDDGKSPNFHVQPPSKSLVSVHSTSQRAAFPSRPLAHASTGGAPDSGDPSPALPGASSELRQPANLPCASAAVPTSTASSSSLNTIPHPLQQAGERPKKVCFLCGEKCLSTKSQVIYGHPTTLEARAALAESSSAAPPSHTLPFFPFIASREPAPNAEPMGEDGGVVVCAYCYYSLLSQWRDYEEGAKRASAGTEADADGPSESRWHRRYTLAEFVCFVCGNLNVPRRSMRTLEVHKFGFLREHRAPPQALVMWGGECVACCRWCHYSLTHQLAEYERLGLPPELRKYNWTGQQPGSQQQPHHLDENSCDTQDSTQDGHWFSTGHNDVNVQHVGSEAEDSNQGPPGALKPLVPVPGSPHADMGKLPPKTATVPPLNHHGGTNSGAGTMRTSGFAAALRKLAYQAKDSTDDPSLKQTGSPPDSHSPRDMTPKLRGQGSSQLNFPSWPLNSAPVVTIAPTQTHPAAHQHSRSRNHERGPPPASLSGGSSTAYEHAHHSHQQHPHHKEHLHHQLQQQHCASSPSSKLDGREQNHHSRQTPLASHARDDEWAKDGRSSSRSSSRITPQASTSPPSSSSFSLTSQALSREALDLYARGFPAYRPEDEALRLGLAGLPYGIDPAAYAAYAAAAAAYHPAILQQQAALAAHSPYRFDDPLLLERYRLLQASSPYLPFPGLAGLSSLAGLGLHPALAAPSQFPPGHLPPPELLQRYPHPYLAAAAGVGQQHPLLDPLLDPRLAAAQAAMLERSRLEEEKARELRESERGRDERRKASAGHSNGSSSSRGPEMREPGERERSRHPSFDDRSSADMSAGHYNRAPPQHGLSAQELSHLRQLSDQRDSRGGQLPPHPRLDKSNVSENKSHMEPQAFRESRAHPESSRDPHVRHNSDRERYLKHEVTRDSHTGSSRSKFSPHSGYTHIIKPYDKVVDQQLSQGDRASNGRQVQDPLQDRHSRLPSTGAEQASPSDRDKHKPQMVSPTVQRPWSSTSSTSSSHQTYNHHHHHHHHHNHAAAVTPTRKDRSSSDFFRPFDEPVNNSSAAKESCLDKRQTPEAHSAERRGEDLRGSSIPSLSSSHHFPPQTLPSGSGSNRSHPTSSFSASILSIPSVKVHPQHWVPSTALHSNLPGGKSTLPSPPALSSSSTLIPHSSCKSSDPGRGLAPPALYPTLQPAGVVSEITPASDMIPPNPFMPTISRYITDRIERFDFKSLARECTTSAAPTAETVASADASAVTGTLKRPVSKLDRREAAFRTQKRRRKLGAEGESFTSSFILTGEACGDEEEESLMSRLTMLSRASPIELDENPVKLDLLEYLGLTTLHKKRELEVKKERRRRHKLRMASLSPVRQHLDTTEMFAASPVSPPPAVRDSEDHHTSHQQDRELTESPVEKGTFAAVLGLRPLSRHQKTELSRQRKLLAHIRRKNGVLGVKANQHSTEKGNPPTSSSLPSTSLTAAPTVVCNPSVERNPFHQEYLVSAGLATEVRSVQASSHSDSDGQEGRKRQDLPETRPDRDFLSRPGGETATERMSKPNPQPSDLQHQDPLLVQQHTLSSSTGLAPSEFSKRTTSQAFINETAKSSAAPSAQMAPLSTHPGSIMHPLHNQPQPHVFSSKPGVPTAAVSGRSQTLDGRGESTYRLVQASPQDMEEAARRMDKHLAMWTSKLTEAEQRNSSSASAKGKFNSGSSEY